tara:strand:+ start:727 stop:900 length:174 start_codon:yes stop_codon:yes gene_type:complete
MTENQMFHIYEKGTNVVVKHSLSVDELEQLIAKREIDWQHWEIQPCYSEYQPEDASF